ncbi:single-stranded-DNA-specific exonuclease RecJ [Taibaiella chishuiensis]|uniref:Single-stranded-DNA-specific exonuclease RecJ n=1 Tax=Taibaiella chishuiensis TaxID=1434707 RepID=A0A2P8DCL9_9BACT|nr:single-stranded-DNA-specific exonuclease RecJ [Taibaiella chishuiensis]PSK94917.1 exonuclease RecJ [Taibaiella chishuiensis]
MAVEKVWKIKHADQAIVDNIAQSIKIHPALCRLLALRGMTDYDSSKDFFRPVMQHLHDPFLMKGMQVAVDRIGQAISRGEKVMIYGDYDVDGTTAVSVVYSFFIKNFPAGLFSFYVPHRYREGYGLSQEGIDTAETQGVTLVITLDCGIKSVERIAYAAGKGIDVIVCDHHTPDDHLPDAVAILNPKQHDCPYPFKELSGCGIGYKLISALAQVHQLPEENVVKYLDLVATSIAADIVPMDGENRVLAYYGIKRANEQPCLALQTIKQMVSIDRDLNISDLVFIIAPRINAAGRMDDARKAIDLFIEEDPLRSKELAEVLHADNFDRKEVDKSMTEEAINLMQQDVAGANNKSTVLFQPHWHKGVVGIVASRLIDHYYRPTIVLTESNGKVTGSARSVNGFNIYEAIHQCGDLLENYGGHYFAAGMTMHPDNLAAFRERFEQVVRDTIEPGSLQPVIDIDAEIRLSDITPGFFNIIRQFEPYGPTNLRPVFMSRAVSDWKGYSRVVKEMHIRFVVAQQEGFSITGIGFGMVDKFGLVAGGQPFDIIYTIDENEWNGSKTLQLKVIDIRAAEAQAINDK